MAGEKLPPGIARSLAEIRDCGYAVHIESMIVTYSGDEGGTVERVMISEAQCAKDYAERDAAAKPRLKIVK
jgi:hypothetical protein